MGMIISLEWNKCEECSDYKELYHDCEGEIYNTTVLIVPNKWDQVYAVIFEELFDKKWYEMLCGREVIDCHSIEFIYEDAQRNILYYFKLLSNYLLGTQSLSKKCMKIVYEILEIEDDYNEIDLILLGFIIRMSLFFLKIMDHEDDEPYLIFDISMEDAVFYPKLC